jgi:hypothetical protein
MAVTKIFSRQTGSLWQLLDYISNDGKITRLPEREQTALRKKASEESEVKYISGQNCAPDPKLALDDMVNTKREWGKDSKVTAHHLIQSFKPGETDPETAHKIGLELAKEVFPDFEVLITTHLDKDHIHNHFAINSVSFIDGHKFTGTQGTPENYKTGIRPTSDDLCRKYGLSVIEHPKYDQNHSYAAHIKRKEAKEGGVKRGTPVSASLSEKIKEDIDLAIEESVSKGQFIFKLREMGYRVKEPGKYWEVIPLGRKKPIRINKDNFLGDDYSFDKLEEKFDANKRTQKTYKVIREVFYHMGLYGKYYNAFVNAGIIKKDNKKRLTRVKSPERMLPEYAQMCYEIKLMREHSVKTHEELMVLRRELEEKVKEVTDDVKKVELMKEIDATYNIERRSRKEKGIKK